MRNTGTNDALKTPSQELTILVEDGIRLLHYVVRHGDLVINQRVAEGITSANAKLNTKHWTHEDEVRLLHSYDELARLVYPVTIESIKAVVPSHIHGKVASPSALKTITWYRRYTVLTLLCLLIAQMFYLFGHTLIDSLLSVPTPLTGTLPADIQANYQLLKKWNHVWMLGNTLELQLNDIAATLGDDVASNRSSIEFSAHLISAQSFLQMLQNYVLPLIYGLLGAFIFVLRSLLQQVRSLTYSASREIGYRLRLTLGCLAGMITGWFLKPEMGEMALSPMAFAFLAGYSIEVLFTLLDKVIDNTRKQANLAHQQPLAPPSTNSRIPPNS
ncbi:hypothetical protein [Marinomonas mediterranea]|jgi:hypothetical protein|uniref:Transmembrane protein n=1 Tax=Marinomonas mediterranea (strain ATCC 700492 / JCM 21426 / NBRC 103028 / MMB-1) TaxID=717774 RepID=F2JXH6_MARM1|nr:hypothetical protein [Marinomonas mediterranea]ADZ91876.1 hypothetical protein Marme_2645 [Marinomonas mediterranea MMB-1]